MYSFVFFYIVFIFRVNSDCHDDQFTCSDGKCIMQNWICDGARDCSDGSDEAHEACDKHKSSNSPCFGNQPECKKQGSFRCIPHEWLCDGHPDCDSGEDELNCSSVHWFRKPENLLENYQKAFSKIPKKCSYGHFKCKSTTKCIQRDKLCDKVKDCEDGSDEDKNMCEMEVTSSEVAKNISTSSPPPTTSTVSSTAPTTSTNSTTTTTTTKMPTPAIKIIASPMNTTSTTSSTSSTSLPTSTSTKPLTTTTTSKILSNSSASTPTSTFSPSYVTNLVTTSTTPKPSSTSATTALMKPPPYLIKAIQPAEKSTSTKSIVKTTSEMITTTIPPVIKVFPKIETTTVQIFKSQDPSNFLKPAENTSTTIPKKPVRFYKGIPIVPVNVTKSSKDD
ncbi:unnamed protein product [Caenorhabditis angaria]|uniref:Uncharacterized protein n=1 Tax=Caenorhabditis angaria TaxID=860376 RepID=A0A9P1J5D0_9PELO|nr:unnamed protein product [Caenorhabditis angaria]